MPYNFDLAKLGLRSRKAWDAAIDVLSPNPFDDVSPWVRWTDVVAAMLVASDILATSCSEMLRRAIAAGLLERRGDWHRGGRDARELRLSTGSGHAP